MKNGIGWSKSNGASISKSAKDKTCVQISEKYWYSFKNVRPVKRFLFWTGLSMVWFCTAWLSFQVGTWFHSSLPWMSSSTGTSNRSSEDTCINVEAWNSLETEFVRNKYGKATKTKDYFYEAMVHPALLASPKSVRRVLAIVVISSEDKLSAVTTPTDAVKAVTDLLTQLVLYKPLRYVQICLLFAQNTIDEKENHHLLEMQNQLQHQLLQIQKQQLPYIIQCNTTNNGKLKSLLLTCTHTDHSRLTIHIHLASSYAQINIKQDGKRNAKEQYYDVVYLQPLTHPCNKTKHNRDFATNKNYNNFVLPTLLKNISSHLLSPHHGLLVLSLGQPPSLSTVPTYANPGIDLLQAPHFQSVHVYQESASSFAMACKTKSCRTFWYASQPILELALQEDYNLYYHQNYKNIHDINHAIDNTTSSIFQFFDVPTMVHKYQRPTKAWESWVCASAQPNLIVECEMLRGFDPAIPNVYRHNFEVKPSTLGPNVGLGLFTKVPIFAPSYIMQEVSVHTVALPPITAMYIEDLIDDFITTHPELFVQELLKILAFAYGYGIQSDMLGIPSGYFVETSIGFLANHGCNGTYNEMSRHSTLKSEMEESIDRFPLEEEDSDIVLFNPVIARHIESEWSYSDSVLRHVDADEELFTNYLQFVVQKCDWAETVRSLRALCSGKEVGLITRATRNARGRTTNDGSDSSTSTADILDKLQKFV